MTLPADQGDIVAVDHEGKPVHALPAEKGDIPPAIQPSDIVDQMMWLTLTASLVQDAEYVQIKTETFARHAQQIAKLLVELRDLRHPVEPAGLLSIAKRCLPFIEQMVERMDKDPITFGTSSGRPWTGWNLLRDLRDDLRKLSAETREVPLGHFWRGLSNREICRNCGYLHSAHLHTDEASLCPPPNTKE